MPKLTDLIADLDEKIIVDKRYTFSDLSPITAYLHHNNIALVAEAAGFLCSLDDPVLLALSNELDTYPKSTQKILVPLMCTSSFSEPYWAMFKLLKTCDDTDLEEILIVALSKTAYGIFPIIHFYLHEAKGVFLDRLSRLLGEMGIDKIGPLLAIFPNVPFEKLFRDLFGDAAIDALYQKN